FDVVASRQRNYPKRVIPMVARWEDVVPEPTLSALAYTPLDASDFGLKTAEPSTMRAVAQNLLAFAEETGQSDDEACRQWAEGGERLQLSLNLDPVVGSVADIGTALFAYMRMRCGANTSKPAVRVAKALRGLRFSTPVDSHSVFSIAQGAAAEI